MEKNPWFFVILALLICLAGANALINIELRAWADLSFSLSMLCLLIPIPDNIKFVTAKLSNQYFRSSSVAALHYTAGFAFLGGVIGKII